MESRTVRWSEEYLGGSNADCSIVDKVQGIERGEAKDRQAMMIFDLSMIVTRAH